MCIRSGRRGGYSLIEILIGSTIALLLLGVIVNLLVSSTRISVKGANQVELQQRSMIVGDRLVRDLRSTTGAGLTLLQDGATQYVAVHPRKAEAGPVAWLQELVVYEWTSPSLKTYRTELGTLPTEAFRPTLGDLTSLSESEKIVTLDIEGVTRFEIEVETGPLVKLGMTFEKGGQKAVLDRVIFLRQGS